MTESHELKTWPQFFHETALGWKPFELRLADRPFNVGDKVRLREFEPYTATYSGAVILAKISCILRYGDVPGLQPGYVILGLSEIDATGANLAR